MAAQISNDTVQVPLKDIVADNSFNCRENLTFIETVELAKSIRTKGLMNAVTVRKIPGEEKMLLIAGYRRYKAHLMLQEENPEKYSTIKATVVICSDLEATQLNLIENVQRTNLNIKEEAHACLRLGALGMSPDAICKELGKSRGWLQNRQWVTDLPLDIQDDIVKYNMTISNIREFWQARDDEALLTAMVNRVKDAKDHGKKITKILKRVRPLDKKLKPTEDECLEAMEKVSKIFGQYNIVTRAMAWCFGNITDRQFYMDCEANKGKTL